MTDTTPAHLADTEGREAYLAQAREGIVRGYPNPSRVVVGHKDGVAYLPAHNTLEADTIRDAIVTMRTELGLDLPTYIQTWDGVKWVDVDEATLAPMQEHTDMFAAHVRSLGAPKRARAKRGSK